MENKFFKMTDTLFDIMDRYPEALDFFISNGFEQLKNKQMLNIMGKTIKLEMALKAKKINPDLLFKGSDYRNYYKLNKNKNENENKMIFTKFISGHSTTSIISRIIELYNN